MEETIKAKKAPQKKVSEPQKPQETKKPAKPKASGAKCFCPDPKAEGGLLQEVYNCTKMAMDSIDMVKKQAQDKVIKTILCRQYNGYKTLATEVEVEAEKLNVSVRSGNIFAKAMVWGNIILSTIADKSASKLAEIMIQGTNMGIINLTKAVNAMSDAAVDLKYADRLLGMFESNIDLLKNYL